MAITKRTRLDFDGIALIIGEDGGKKRGFAESYRDYARVRDGQAAGLGMHPERARRLFLSSTHRMVADAERTGTMRREIWNTHSIPVIRAYQDMIALRHRASTYFDDDDWQEDARFMCDYDNVFVVLPVGQGTKRLTEIHDRDWLAQFHLDDLYLRGYLDALDDGDMPWCIRCATRHRDTDGCQRV